MRRARALAQMVLAIATIGLPGVPSPAAAENAQPPTKPTIQASLLDPGQAGPAVLSPFDKGRRRVVRLRGPEPEPEAVRGAAGGVPHRRYSVAPGDTLYGVAQRFGTSWCAIMRASRLQDPHRIQPGVVLKVPLAPQDCGRLPAAAGAPDLPAAVADPSAPPPAQPTTEEPPDTRPKKTRRQQSTAERVSGVRVVYYTCIPEGFCGRMANGRRVGPGWAACDRNLMPFGTRFRIVSDRSGTIWTCGDTGAFSGWVVDLWFRTSEEGRRYVAPIGTSATIWILR